MTLSSFQAQANGDTVDFILLAEIGGVSMPLNDELIPAPVIDSVEPTEYRFSAQSAATVFYLEEVDINGASRRYGPFVLGQVFGVYVAGPDQEDDMQSIFLPVVVN